MTEFAAKVSKPFHVLITSLSKKAPLVREVRKALKRISENGKIVGGDSNPQCIGRYFVDEFWRMPKLENLTIKEFIDFCLEKQITIVIPSRDGDLLYFAENCAELECNGIHAMISSPHGVKVCMDKLRFYEELRQYPDIPVIPTAENISKIKSRSYVVKERFGAGSENIALNIKKEDAETHAKSLKNPVFQPVIYGKEFSVDLYILRDGNPKGAVTRSRDLIKNGESQVTTTVRKPALEKACISLASAVDLRGHLVFQAIEDEDGRYHIVECNCRFGGASTLSIAVGLDSFYWFILESRGDDLSRIPFQRSEKDLRQIRFAQDMIIDAVDF